MITFKEKVEQSREILRMIAREYDNPIINSGFGKDSICLVHLANRDMKLNWPIMFHRDPYFPEKYRFANEIIRKWNIVAWDYPPRNTSVFYRNGVFEVARHYGIGAGDLALCAQLYTPERFIEGEYLCALRDVYQQPLGTFDFRWDVCLSGHRFVETKPHSGHKQAGIKWAHKHNVGSCDVSYPLREWTNQDVLAYHKLCDIPINADVYDEINGELIPKGDNRFNPDRRPACFECMKKDNPLMVVCPKRMCLVNNVSAGLRHMGFPPDHAWGREEDGI